MNTTIPSNVNVSKVAANYAHQNTANTYNKEVDRKSQQLQPVNDTHKTEAKSERKRKPQSEDKKDSSKSKFDFYA